MAANVNFDKNFTGGIPVLDEAGDTITYEFSVQHQGGDNITNLLLGDSLLGFSNFDLLAAVTAGTVVLSGDTNANNIFESGETWTFTEAAASNVFTYTLTQQDLDSNGTNEPDPTLGDLPGQIDNEATLVTRNAAGTIQSNSLETASALLTIEPEIAIVKETNGTDDECPDILVGETVTWTYTVTNPGNVALSNVVISDDNGTPGDPSDDFNPTFVGGDTNGDGALDVGETWTYETSGTAVAGEYTNIATANGDFAPSPEVTIAADEASEDDCYTGVEAGIAIVKTTNGTDDVCPVVAVGSAILWGYTVTNTGDLAIENVVVVDDAGTAGDPSDDFSPTFVGGDTDGDGALDVGETWTYSANGIAQVGAYENVATVDGEATDEVGNTANVTANEDDCYFGADVQIAILKETNGTDDECPDVLVGETVTWTYTVTNPGNVALSNVVIVDDAGTPGDPSDDFNPAFVGGDTNGDGLLDTSETWTYETSGTAAAGEYTNIATANGDYVASAQLTIAADEASEDDCYDGVEAGIAIVKTTNGTNDVCPVVAVGSAILWGYTVTNTGDLAIENVVVVDDAGTAGDPSDDFNPTFVGGDTDGDGALDVGETWTYSANGIAQAGAYVNVATVDGDATDESGNTTNVTANEDDCYTGEEPEVCVGVGTPGFWANNGAVFWDGDGDNNPKAGDPGFPTGDLLYAVDSNNDTFINGSDEEGLLIGDFNRDGLSAGEDTIFISFDDARALIEGGGGSNGVDKIGRDVVATWLNFLANGEGCIDLPGTSDDGFSPEHYINDAVDWLQQYASDEDSHAVNFAVFDDSTVVATGGKNSVWDKVLFGDHSGAQIHSALDNYNNTGFINGLEFCCDRDSFTIA